ncbi:MAG: hypothetical protein HOP30_12915 [Cyclobacteriaceae bacterium]|nr:hypothetical protein [Cyclobacteriaceae bacterium]
MELDQENLRRFFEKLRSIGLLERIFGWGKIISQLVDANGELQKLITKAESLKTENSRLEGSLTVEKVATSNLQQTVSRLETENVRLSGSTDHLLKEKEERVKELSSLSEANKIYLRRGTELSNELAVTKSSLERSELESKRMKEQLTQFQSLEEHRKSEYEKSMAALNQIQQKIQKDREAEVDIRNRTEIERLKRLKETWTAHEENVKGRIKAICNRHGIDYIDKVPFKGSPDNTIKIKDEFIIFDAKSPASDDLSNFPSYIKNQTDSISKYVKEEGVRRELFLVVPTNTLDALGQYEYKLPDYTVFVISIDSLEPIILSLKKIEDYDFVDQLSPEERENICRVIGKFVHLSKRRIQIDGFFAKQFFELVYRSEADLPKDILDKVVEFEKSEKLNPPIEKRAKQINLKELELENDKINSEANQKGIVTHDSLLMKEINKLPLYTTQVENPKNKDQAGLFEF